MAVNAFIAWRFMQIDLNELPSQTLDVFGSSLNHCQCLADFVHKAITELLQHAEELDGVLWTPGIATSSHNAQYLQLSAETRRPRLRAVQRKRKRLEFFNSEDGKLLRLFFHPHHPFNTTTMTWCAYYGTSHKNGEGKST